MEQAAPSPTLAGLLKFAGEGKAKLITAVRNRFTGTNKEFFHFIIQEHAKTGCPKDIDEVGMILWDYKRKIANI